MAKQTGPFKFGGSMGDYVFYKLNGKDVIRRKPEKKSEEMKTSTKYVRSRENGSEFGAASGAGKLFRDGLGWLYSSGSDAYAYQRLAQLMAKVKTYDAVSVRGERKVSIGFKDKKAYQLLVDFRFNEALHLTSVLKKPVSINEKTNLLQIPDFSAKKSLKWPKPATHVTLQGVILTIDFEQKKTLCVLTNAVRLGVNSSVCDLELKPEKKIGATQVARFYLLRILFEQENNGTAVELVDGKVVGVVS